MMGLTINTNTGSMNTVRNLSMMQRALNKTMDKLSSGQKINSAADNPAGLVISEQMRAQIGSIAQKVVNLDTVINKNNTADSALMQMEDNLLEMRDMAVAATSTGSADENMVEAYENAMNNSVDSFNKVVEESSFGNTKLLDGSEGSVADIKLVEEFDLTDSAKAEEAIATIDGKLAEIQKVHGELGATTTHELASMRSSLEISHNNLVAAESNIRDTDMAKEQTNFVSQLLRLQSSTAMLAQGNQLSQAVFGLITG